MRTWGCAVAGLLVTLVLAAMPVPAAASCVAAAPAELFQLADVVFYGRVVDQNLPVREGGTSSRFAVERVLKGQVGAAFTLWETTGPAPFPQGWLGQGMSTSVDVDYRMGKRYMMFVHRTEDGWRSSTCSGTRPLASLTAETLAGAGLGELATYLPGDQPDPSLEDAGRQVRAEAVPPGTGMPWWLAIEAGLALLVAAVAGYRAFSRRPFGS